MVGDILNSQAVQMGADLMGHYDIPHTPFTLFGLLAVVPAPNTRINKDPLGLHPLRPWACSGLSTST